MQENILGNLHRFLGIDESDENDASLEERTKSAIVLLQCLPCARSAIFEQIGEVFHEVAKKYVIEVEKQMLSGKKVSISSPLIRRGLNVTKSLPCQFQACGSMH